MTIGFISGGIAMTPLVLCKESSIAFSGASWYTDSMKKHHLTLTDDHRSTLETLLSKGILSARTFKRATALLELDRGKTLQAVAASLSVTYNAVAKWRDGYTARGLTCLDDA